MAIWTELPDGQFYIWLVLSVAGNPYLILFLDIVGIGQVFVDKVLTDIQDGLHAKVVLHRFHPNTDAVQKYLCSSHLLDEGSRRLHIEHRWKVARVEEGILDEIVGLLHTAGAGGEEMIGSAANAVVSGILVVVDEILIGNGGFCGTLDLTEGEGVVNLFRHTLVATRAYIVIATLT